LSRLFDSRGRPLEEPFPIRPSAGTRRPALAAEAARAVHRQPTALRANHFSRIYESILPSSLAYIVPSTRDCSPWRPDAVMSTTRSGWHWVLQIFKGRRGGSGHHATRSTWARALGFTATVAPSYSSRPGTCPDGRVSAQLGTVTRLPVQGASPVLLTKNGPFGALDSVVRLNEAAAPSYLFKV
ncbi:hypothetical protein Dsin_008199, partial [Dipteronia sinensis]